MASLSLKFLVCEVGIIPVRIFATWGYLLLVSSPRETAEKSVLMATAMVC